MRTLSSLPSAARLALCAAVIAMSAPAGAGLAALAMPGRPDTASAIVISALHYSGRDGINDEAIQITNMSPLPATLDGNWSFVDAVGHQRAFANPGLTLGGGQRAWIARNANAFAAQFGAQPALTFGQMTGADLAFPNHGGSLQLLQVTSDTLDTANVAGGAWPAGTASPAYRSMERIDPGGPDAPGNWTSAWISAAVAFDGYGNMIQGTPGAPNSLLAAGLVTPSASGRGVVINEIAWSGTQASSTHEWIELFNNLTTTVAITGWELRIGASVVTLAGAIGPRRTFLIQRSVAIFSDGATAQQTASFSLSNSGAAVRLVDERTRVVDALVYGDGGAIPGWLGPALQPYTIDGVAGADGQVLARRLGTDGLPVPDSNRTEGWLSDPDDLLDGRRIDYPGWSLETLGAPLSASSGLTLAIAPDGSYALLESALLAAQQTIDVEVYTFDQPQLAVLLADKVRSGVRVRVLLEGAPVGGMTDQERWACQTLSSISASSGCWYLRSDAAQNIVARYRALHAKFAILDDRQLVIGSENFGVNGFPDDDKSDGTVGHRGVVAILDSPALVARARAVFTADYNPAIRDFCQWGAADCPMGAPIPGYAPITVTGGVSYTVRFTRPLVTAGPVMVELNTSPENTLRRAGGLIGMIDTAGAGDEIMAEQLSEPLYWGPSASNRTDDPNPRIEALLGAARRGARVRLLLDGFYDDASRPRSNAATAAALNALAQAEQLNLRVALGDPTAHGIHNKLVLARVGGRKIVHLGSWNGTEASAKINREMTIQFESAEAYGLLRGMFENDFWISQPQYLPSLYRNWSGPPRRHLLISEVLFNPAGGDEVGREWIELYNPGAEAVSLAGHKIGDAEFAGRSYNEGMARFPDNAVIPAGGAIIVAADALKYQSDWGRRADYELGGYDAGVPDLLAYSPWSTGTLALGNLGDQVLLLGPDDAIIDAAQWLTTTLAGVAPYTMTLGANHTLQRWPPTGDTDNCASDFRDQGVPSPGTVP
ncbi:MAG TPA: lamin tail domain-containing protein [Thermoflexales bacterium]|nr:lamin tail domain-containing protein [Thermoflexales bacterium]HQX09636.1 lamin tail domain-containing protein [Thermoflexales bacterium]HQY24970.1 lamin tail domain-containing protein [Thermoflexales bacterium]